MDENKKIQDSLRENQFAVCVNFETFSLEGVNTQLLEDAGENECTVFIEAYGRLEHMMKERIHELQEKRKQYITRRDQIRKRE